MKMDPTDVYLRIISKNNVDLEMTMPDAHVSIGDLCLYQVNFQESLFGTIYDIT